MQVIPYLFCLFFMKCFVITLFVLYYGVDGGQRGAVCRSWLLPVPSSFFQGAGTCAGLFALLFMALLF